MKRGTRWHPGEDIPPLRKWKWTDDDGIIHNSRRSDWMLVEDDTCDPEYTGTVVVARYEKDDNFSGWVTANGSCEVVFRWHTIPKKPVGAGTPASLQRMMD